MELIFVILAAYGIANILAKGSIFNSFRSWLEINYPVMFNLITCPMCLGFWLGLGLGIIYGPFMWYNPLNGPFYSAGIWIINCFVQFLGGGYDPSRTINLVTVDPLMLKEVKK